MLELVVKLRGQFIRRSVYNPNPQFKQQSSWSINLFSEMNSKILFLVDLRICVLFRLLLAAAGQDYEDHRFPFSTSAPFVHLEWDTEKKENLELYPFGQIVCSLLAL